MTCTCGNPTTTWLCDTCAEAFEYRLAEVDTTVQELQALIPRLTLTATYGLRASGPQVMHAPAPVNVDVVSAEVALHRWLMSTALRLAEVTGVFLGGRSCEALSSYLVSHLPRLRSLSWCVGLPAELDGLLRGCVAVARVAERKVFAGSCAECSTDLYAVKGSDSARCRTCGAVYEVAAWRAHASTAKEYHVGSPAELSRALTSPAYGVAVSVNQICMWAKRGKLKRANEEHDEHGNVLKPTYRLKDVLDLNAARKPIDGMTA